MNDKEIMEGILLTTKGVCDLYMHGSIESATPNVHEAFSTALNDSLCMQDGIYKQMASRGWYPSEQAPQQQLQQVKQKYSAMGLENNRARHTGEPCQPVDKAVGDV